MFKNLMVYALAAEWCAEHNYSTILEAVEKHPLLPVNAASMRSQGWIACNESQGPVWRVDESNLILALATEERILPPAVIKRAVKTAAAELAKAQGFAPGRKQLRDLKDKVIDELRPRAFIKQTATLAWIDLANHTLAVNASSVSKADDLCTVLRCDIGDLPAVPLRTKIEPSVRMAQYLMLPKDDTSHFAIESSCDMVGEDSATVKMAACNLAAPTVVAMMVTDGKRPARLAMNWRDRVGFTLTDKLEIRRIRSLVEADDETSGKQTAEDSAQTDAILICGDMAALIADLTTDLGGRAE